MDIQVVAVPDEALASIARDAGVDVSLLTDPENPRALFVNTGTLEYSRPVHDANGNVSYTHMYKDISYLNAQPGESWICGTPKPLTVSELRVGRRL